MIERLDHVNLRTTRLDEMKAWYGEVLDMTPGPRPDFGFHGAWMYANGQALVHLVEVEVKPADHEGDLSLEHAAFKATDMAAFVKKLDARGERYKIIEISDFGITQVNIWDPDGNHLHIDFLESEAAG